MAEWVPGSGGGGQHGVNLMFIILAGCKSLLLFFDHGDYSIFCFIYFIKEYLSQCINSVKI